MNSNEGGNTKLSISFDIDLSTLIDVVLENNDSENINCEIWRYIESDVYILTYGLAILKSETFRMILKNNQQNIHH
ncbi:unnamed protein product [Rhizophagus irregularis]|nr:unnamed protein product [Rhizophagus irregularis]